MTMCKKLNVKCVSHGVQNAKELLAIRRTIWNENDQEIRAELVKSDKVRSIVKPKF